MHPPPPLSSPPFLLLHCGVELSFNPPVSSVQTEPALTEKQTLATRSTTFHQYLCEGVRVGGWEGDVCRCPCENKNIKCTTYKCIHIHTLTHTCTPSHPHKHTCTPSHPYKHTYTLHILTSTPAPPHTLTFSRNQPGPTPLLSCPTVTCSRGETSQGERTSNLSVCPASRDLLPLSTHTLPLSPSLPCSTTYTLALVAAPGRSPVVM